MKANIKLTIQYDGTNFNGWQVQKMHPQARTVQGVLEKALERIVKEPIKLIGAGRTDSGVHAKGQVANFHTTRPIPVEKWPIALNSILPPDVAVIEAEEVPEKFHARYWAKRKTYYYYILNRRYPDVFLRNYAYYISQKLNLEDMRRAAQLILGTHDFRSFCAAGSSVKNYRRTVFEADFSFKGELLIFKITADGFLHKMVRLIMGTLIEIGRGKYPSSWMKEVLEARDVKKSGPAAPPHGLYLCKVYYE
ncbi:MAG TPA: tRNA pseudouridine(38-40) synthase TruA [Peptococcaceae bacterium]|nr:MAG: tRNA pseudouridine synthase A [Clostridia bacterium 41_269]HBT20937.1 tRNA pseudouridine(38-40) synthase TruA [Peptococcaceae bacterium]